MSDLNVALHTRCVGLQQEARSYYASATRITVNSANLCSVPGPARQIMYTL